MKLATLNQEIVGSRVTVAFIELEIKQLCSAFSISSSVLAPSVPDVKVIEGLIVIAVNWNLPSTNSNGPSAVLS